MAHDHHHPNHTHDHNHQGRAEGVTHRSLGEGGHPHHDHNHHGPEPKHGHRHNIGGHSHLPAAGFGRMFMLGIVLNLGFVVAEGGFGYLGNSVSLVADAGHNLMDVLGLLVAWSAAVLTAKPPSHRFTYGLGSSSILAALANALLLLVAVVGIGYEAVDRFNNPQPVATTTVIIVASLGIFVNGFTAALFMRGGHDDINIRGAFLHMAADALVSLGVVVSALCIRATGWQWIDPMTSILIVGVIVWSAWSLFGAALNMALHGVPGHIDPAKVRAHLLALGGVKEVHDLHIWPMSTTETALTCHLMMPKGHPGDKQLAHFADTLHAGFGIGHSTFQVEIGDGDRCKLEPADTV